MQRRFSISIGTRVLAAAGMALALGVAAPSTANAAECDISQFVNPDGTTDLTGYLACSNPAVSNSNASQGGSSLARTGRDLALTAGVGAATAAIGAGAIVGSRRAKRSTAT